MQRTRIKICGVMRPEDAIAAAEAGADAIGLNFYSRARRCIDIETARRIIAVLPPFVTPVGLFVNAAVDDIRRVADTLRLRHIQLHGEETLDLVAKLDSYVILKAVCADRSTLEPNLEKWKEANLPHLRGLLLDTPNTGVAGGSGVENDWKMIAEFVQSGLFQNAPPLIVAGGLNPANVADVVRLLRPWAVDVSSGVEESFGKKSAEKIRAIVAAVHNADQAIINRP